MEGPFGEREVRSLLSFASATTEVISLALSWIAGGKSSLPCSASGFVFSSDLNVFKTMTRTHVSVGIGKVIPASDDRAMTLRTGWKREGTAPQIHPLWKFPSCSTGCPLLWQLDLILV